MQILIVKTSSMGDILHTLPALTDAMHVLRNIQFDWVVEENFTQIPTWHPVVRRVIPVAIRRWRNNWFGIASRQERDVFKRLVQVQNYDAVIDAQGLIKSAALVTRLAYGEKHGMNYKSAREPYASWFYNYRHEVDNEQHAIERIRQLFAASLGYVIPSQTGDYAITSHFSTKQDNMMPYLIFLHATTHPKKHWLESHWRTMIDLAGNAGYQIKLPWWTERERQSAERMAKGFNHAVILPRLLLADVAKQLLGALAVVSVDTGLSHLAAALNCRNLTLYGPTNKKLIGCYGRHQYALCSENKTMRSLTAERVWHEFSVKLLLK